MNCKNKSGWRGVSWNVKSNRWHVAVGARGRKVYVGVFYDPVEAAKAYDAAARHWHGPDASVNFPVENTN